MFISLKAGSSCESLGLPALSFVELIVSSHDSVYNIIYKPMLLITASYV